MAKSSSKVFKAIRFAKMDPDHQKAGPFSTDDEEHYTVSTQEYEQQVKHVKKRAMQEAKDPGEYDQEGDMAMTQLRSIMYHAQELHDQLNKDDNLPEWVQSKITLAQDYMQTACDYMYAQKNVKEEVEKSTGDLKDACWTGYTAVGMKMKNGKKVPNCVPVKEAKEVGDDPTGSSAQETLVKKGGKTTVAKPIAESSSVAVRMQRALDRIKAKREASEQRGREVLQPKKPEPVKEDVEQLDEISTKTLASAAKSASDPDSDYHYGKSHDPQKFADHAKKTKDAKSAAAVQGAADAKGHYARPGHTLGSYDKLAHRTPARVTSAGKANKQDVNRLKGNIQRNEDVEQLDELSPNALGDYMKAGHKKYDSIRNNTDSASMAKKSKLETGIKKAAAKRYPAKPSTPEPKKDPNSRGYEQGRYMGDSVEHEESLIEDKMGDTGWQKSKSKTDTVTDKSGAVHTAQSKVRDLARRAMKAAGAKQANSVGAKSMKESTLVESRKTEIIKDAADSAKKKKTASDKFEANPTLDSQIQKVDNT